MMIEFIVQGYMIEFIIQEYMPMMAAWNTSTRVTANRTVSLCDIEGDLSLNLSPKRKKKSIDLWDHQGRRNRE